jgi:FtsP/CotA-like multicopper oxidase with cupredoxin domain
MISRRGLIVSSAATVVAGKLVSQLIAAEAPAPAPVAPPPAGNGSYVPIETPNGSTLPWTMEDGFKTFRLIAEPVKREFSPGMIVNCWGYNGQSPGPTIEAVEGDKVRIYVTNRLPEPTTIHWHGIILPAGQDGVAGLTQPHINPGETFAYEFELKQHGTQMYHPHGDEMLQMAMGMQGFFIIHPKQPRSPELKVDREFAIFLQEWFIPPGGATPNPMIMTDFNIFTFNSRVWPGTAPLVVRRGERVRIRLANLSMDNHPIHFHGHVGYFTGTDGGPLQQSAWQPMVTIDVPPGSTRDLEFVADNPGDWPLHCHKNHHAMNAMSHEFPNMTGVNMKGVEEQVNSLLPGYMHMGEKGMMDMADMEMQLPPNTIPMMTGNGPFGPIGMGGMFTLIKVRDDITTYKDPGWYKHPEGSIVRKVSGPAAAVAPVASAPRPAHNPATPATTAPATPGVVYVCPMHEKVTSTVAGSKCPICFMKLKPKK